MVLQISMGQALYSDWGMVEVAAMNQGVYPASLYVGDDGLIYGDAAEGQVVLGRWTANQPPPRDAYRVAGGAENIFPGLNPNGARVTLDPLRDLWRQITDAIRRAWDWLVRALGLVGAVMAMLVIVLALIMSRR